MRMSEHVSDPISAAIEHHRMADAAFDASIARDADEAIKASHEKREGAALRILLRTEPQTIAGCLAVLRYVVDWADNKDAGFSRIGVRQRR
jgi:hypothetical protein